MHNSKLLQLIKTFQAKEFAQFEKIVAIKITTKDGVQKYLFECIKKSYPALDSEMLTKEKILQKLKLTGDEGDKKLRYAASTLTQYAEQFLIEMELNANPDIAQTLLLNQLNKRHLHKYHEQVVHEEQLKIDKNPHRDIFYFQQQLRLDELKYKALRPHELRGEKNNLQQLADRLDLVYISNKLHYTCELLNNNNAYSFKFKSRLLDEIMRMIDLQEHPTPIISIYKQVLLTLQNPNEEQHIFQLKKELHEHKLLLAPVRMRDMYAYIQNFYVRRINTGLQQYYVPLFEHFKTLLNEGLFTIDGYFNEFSFKNIVVIALRLGEVAWAESFIKKYELHLEPEHCNNAMTYNRAYILFHKHEWGASLELLNQVAFTDVYYHLDSKSLLLKIYFELEEEEPFYSLVEAFRVYLKRNKKASEQQVLHYSNFILYCNKIFKLKMNTSKNAKIVMDELQQAQGVADKIWLQRKLDAMLDK